MKPRGGTLRRRLGLAALVLLTGMLIGVSFDLLRDWEQMLVDMIEHARQSPRALIVGTLVYALCLAVPFVPGVELGILLMIAFGKVGILMAYAGTLVGLNLAFGAGWLLRHHWQDRFGEWRHQAADLQGFGRVSLSRTRLGRALAFRLGTEGRITDYLLVAFLFNLPGNSLIGGGGGIALVAGLSGRLRWLGYLPTVILATAAVPLLVWLGVLELERLLGSLVIAPRT